MEIIKNLFYLFIQTYVQHAIETKLLSEIFYFVYSFTLALSPWVVLYAHSTARSHWLHFLCPCGGTLMPVRQGLSLWGLSGSRSTSNREHKPEALEQG